MPIGVDCDSNVVVLLYVVGCLSLMPIGVDRDSNVVVLLLRCRLFIFDAIIMDAVVETWDICMILFIACYFCRYSSRACRAICKLRKALSKLCWILC